MKQMESLLSLILVTFCVFNSINGEHLISGDELNGVCETALRLKSMGLNYDQVKHVVTNKLIKISRSSTKQPSLGYMAADGNTVTQSGTMNINVNDLIALTVGMMEGFCGRSETKDVCKSFDFPDQVDLDDQQQVNKVLDNIKSVKNLNKWDWDDWC